MAVLAFGVTVACVSPLPDGAQAPRWALISLGIPLICWRSSVVLPIRVLAPVLAIGASLLWSPAPWAGLQLWWHLSLLVLVALAAPTDMRPVYFAMGAGLAVNTAVVLLQLAGLEPVSHVDGQVASGLFFNKNQQNCLVALVIIALISLRDWRADALAGLACLPLLISPISRAPLLALAVVGVCALYRRHRWLALTAGTAGLVVLLLVFIGMPDRLESNALRLNTWIDSFRHISFLGHGLGAFIWQYPEMQFAHNDLLQVVYELGLAGLVIAAIIIFKVVNAGPSVERLILLAFAVEGAFDFPLYQPAAGFVAALALGHVLRARARLRDPVAVGECADRDRPALAA